MAGYPVVEQAAGGYDPSIGRVVTEQSNNGVHALLLTGTPTAVIKASPGYVKTINISTFAAVTTGTHVVLYDSATVPAAGSASMIILPLPAAGAAASYDLNQLFVNGLSIAVCSITAATGVTAGHAFTGGGVGVSIAYR